MDYTQGKIYRILLGGDGDYYIGSTTVPLEKRLQSHRYMAKKHPTIPVYKKALDLKWEGVTIELIEEYPCSSKKELLLRETTFINLSDPLCQNVRPALLTPEERKAKEKEQNARYRTEHLDYLREKNRAYKAARPPLSDEEKEARRAYQREYMRARRERKRKNLTLEL